LRIHCNDEADCVQPNPRRDHVGQSPRRDRHREERLEEVLVDEADFPSSIEIRLVVGVLELRLFPRGLAREIPRLSDLESDAPVGILKPFKGRN
jgi:hypothetical protein